MALAGISIQKSRKIMRDLLEFTSTERTIVSTGIPISMPGEPHLLRLRPLCQTAVPKALHCYLCVVFGLGAGVLWWLAGELK